MARAVRNSVRVPIVKLFTPLVNKKQIQEVNGRKPINFKYAGKIFHLSDELSAKYPNGVRFTKEGYPDFSPYATKSVKIKFTGNRAQDFSLANKDVGYNVTPRGYTWHHMEDKETMQLVPRDLHRAVGHTGGFSMYP
jgi:hypothetical protein